MSPKLACALPLCALASCASVVHRSLEPATAPRPQAARAEPSRDNRISLYLGERKLDKSDYEPVNEQAAYGLELLHETAGGDFGVEFGVLGSSEEDNAGGFRVKGETREVYLGVRKTLGESVMRPYFGGGVSFIRSDLEIVGTGEDDDDSPALYLHGGLSIDVSESFFIALDLRGLLGSDIELFGSPGDADYGQLALVAGVIF
jgi:hypothetical protein